MKTVLRIQTILNRIQIWIPEQVIQILDPDFNTIFFVFFIPFKVDMKDKKDFLIIEHQISQEQNFAITL